MTNLSDLFPAPTGGTTNVPSTVTYTPAMMQFDGSSSYYNGGSPTYSGNKVTGIARVKIPSYTGGYTSRILNFSATGGFRLFLAVYASDHTTAGRRNKLNARVQNSSGTVVCSLWSDVDVADGNYHTIMFSFDGDNGTAQLIIDGSNADDTGNAERVAPTTATLATATPLAGIGARPDTGEDKVTGYMGFISYMDAYLTNWSDFMDSSGNPIKQDTTTWANSGWGSQPMFWNEAGEMSNNLGSAGNMTKNGTINVADEPLSSNGWVLPIGDQSADLTTGTGKFTFRMPTAFTLEEVRASVTTAPTGSAIQVDINESGVSVLSTVISIDAGEKSSTTAATPPVISDSALADDAEITIDIDQVGSTVAGAGLKVYLLGRSV